MFGMGFMEIFLVLMVAIVALGPEKLPNAVVDIAKFFKKFKTGIDDAKSTLDKELNISEMKQQAADLKVSMEEVTNVARIDMDSLSTDNLLNDEPTKPKQKEPTKEKQKKAKKEKISLDKEANI